MRLSPILLVALLAAALPAQVSLRSGINRDDMDPTCKPCTDFWRHVNGGWLDRNPIPAHLKSWGSFSVLAEANRERTRTILEAAAADRNAAPNSNQRKMGDLYASCMDTAAIDARGIKPLQPDFDRIAAIRSVEDLSATLAFFQQEPIPAQSPSNGVVVGPFRVIARLDQKNPTRMIVSVVERDGAGGSNTSIFSLPDRDYYFKQDPKSRQIREEFARHVTKLLSLAGDKPDTAQQHAKMVMDFETALAESAMDIAARRDPDSTYHLMDTAALKALTPNFDWPAFLRHMGVAESSSINVTEPELLKKFNHQLTAVPLEEWKTWLRWRVVKISAPFLSKPIADEEFHFANTILNGVQTQRPRWQVCGDEVDRDLSDALGEAFVKKYFPPEAKRRMAELVENLRAAMRVELENSEWMQPETKKNAIHKLDVLRVKIGYPDRWRDYSTLKIDRAAYFESVRAAWRHKQSYQLGKLGRPVDHNDWTMTPPTVNAYSNAGQVEIVFPAGILQPPFFDLDADDSVNYAAIGSVIGHEMGHQFDDGGSKYDATGKLANWWTPEDRKQFEQRTACVVDQFNSLDLGDHFRHNGKLVLGESLGDLGGITVAYRAYRRANPQPKEIDGFTGDQRFFIAFARIWGTEMRDEAKSLQVNTNPHPLPKYRAVATLQNIPEFQRAFHCKELDPMVRQNRCKLW